jgi:hypothetical protein
LHRSVNCEVHIENIENDEAKQENFFNGVKCRIKSHSRGSENSGSIITPWALPIVKHSRGMLLCTKRYGDHKLKEGEGSYTDSLRVREILGRVGVRFLLWI